MIDLLIVEALACLPLAVGITPVQDTAEVRPAAIGSLRHVQLLGVTGGDQPTMRLATAMRRGPLGKQGGRIAIIECSADSKAFSSEPVAVVDLPYEVLPMWSYMKPVSWRVLETESATWLVAHDRHRGVTEIRDVASGEVQITIGGTSSFEDVRVDGDVIELLAIASAGARGTVSYPISVERIRWTIGADGVERRSLSDVQGTSNRPLGRPVAVFARTSAGGPAASTIVVAAMSGFSPVFHVFDAGSKEARTLTPTIEQPGKSSLRLRAWQAQGKLRIALGMPGWDNSTGRVIVMAADAGEPTALVADIFPNEMSLEGTSGLRAGSAFSFAYGQALDFVNDMDGDDIPDLAVGAPLVIGGVTDLVSSATGKRLRRGTPPGTRWNPLGACVSTSPCGHWVLTTEGEVGYPEVFTRQAVPVLIEFRN